MDEQKSPNWGGKRKGAGRKKQPTTKYPLTFYFRKGQELVFGSKEKMKAKVYEFIEKYGEEEVTASQKAIHAPDSTFEIPKMKPHFDVKRRTYHDYVIWKREIEDPEEYQSQFLPALNADQWLTTKEKQSIKML